MKQKTNKESSAIDSETASQAESESFKGLWPPWALSQLKKAQVRGRCTSPVSAAQPTGSLQSNQVTQWICFKRLEEASYFMRM
jgi:hypothetical protein